MAMAIVAFLAFILSASGVLCLQDSGVPCYLHPADDPCHYFTKADPTECMSSASKVALNKRILHLNKTLTGLEQLLVRLGVIPPDDACPELPAVANGGTVYSYLNLAPGCSARYICDEGYTLFGHRSFNCTDGGIWEGNITQIPTCELTAAQCDPLTDIDNGNVTYEDDDPANTLPGDMVSYACDADYELQGPEQRFCLKTGNWSGVEPQCIEVKPSGLKNKAYDNKSIIIGVTIGGVVAMAIAVVLIAIGGRAAYKKWKDNKVTSGLIVENEPTTASVGGHTPIFEGSAAKPERTASAHANDQTEPKKKGRAGHTYSELEHSL